MEFKIDYDSPVYLFRQTERGTHNDLTGEGHDNLKLCNKKVDFSEKLGEFYPDEFPKGDWENKMDLENWLQEQLAGYPDGIYYLFTRCIVIYPLVRKKKKKGGRPRYSYSGHGECYGKRSHLPQGKPYRKASGKWVCLAKFEIYENEVIDVPDKMSPRKYSPYTSKMYPLIKAVTKKKKLI